MNGVKMMINVKKEDFQNSYDGKKVFLYTVSNGTMSFSVTNYGATVTKIEFPSKNDKFAGYCCGL